MYICTYLHVDICRYIYIHGFWSGTTDHTIKGSKVTPRPRPCDSGSPRTKPSPQECFRNTS